MTLGFTFLSNEKILDWSKLKAFADDKINVNETLKFSLGREENTVEKGENAGYQHFLLFPMFSKALCYSVINPFPKQALVFTCLQCKAFENNVGKGEIAHNEQFLLFPHYFQPFSKTFCHLPEV